MYKIKRVVCPFKGYDHQNLVDLKLCVRRSFLKKWKHYSEHKHNNIEYVSVAGEQVITHNIMPGVDALGVVAAARGFTKKYKSLYSGYLSLPIFTKKYRMILSAEEADRLEDILKKVQKNIFYLDEI